MRDRRPVITSADDHGTVESEKRSDWRELARADEPQRLDWRISVACREDLTKGALIGGGVADGAVSVVDITWHGSEVLTVTYRSADGHRPRAGAAAS